MGAGTVVGYLFLFLILFILIAAHPGFVLLFFLTIIVIIAYHVNKRKKQNSGFNRTYPKNYSNKQTNLDRISTDNYSNWKVDNSYESKNAISSKKIINSARFIPDDKQIYKKNNDANAPNILEKNSLDVLKQNKSLDAIHTSSEKNTKEFIEKKSFNENYWNFGYGESIYSKKLKFEEAIKFCENNNLGSKAKIRRVRMKFNRWDVENERDIEAIMPEYDYLTNLIKGFENQ